MFYPMQATTEATFAKHRRYISWSVQKSSGQGEVAAKVQDSNQGRCHDFGIAHSALGIFPVMNRLQIVVTNAVNDYDLCVHESFLLLTVWLLSTLG